MNLTTSLDLNTVPFEVIFMAHKFLVGITLILLFLIPILVFQILIKNPKVYAFISLMVITKIALFMSLLADFNNRYIFYESSLTNNPNLKVSLKIEDLTKLLLIDPNNITYTIKEHNQNCTKTINQDLPLTTNNSLIQINNHHITEPCTKTLAEIKCQAKNRADCINLINNNLPKIIANNKE